jgi:hypothetical protein
LIAGLGAFACSSASAQTNYYFARRPAFTFIRSAIFSALRSTVRKVVQDNCYGASTTISTFRFHAVVFARLWSEFGRDGSQGDALRKQGRVWAQLLTAYIEGGRIFKSFD